MDAVGAILIGVIFWALIMLTYVLCQIRRSGKEKNEDSINRSDS